MYNYVCVRGCVRACVCFHAQTTMTTKKKLYPRFNLGTMATLWQQENRTGQVHVHVHVCVCIHAYIYIYIYQNYTVL